MKNLLFKSSQSQTPATNEILKSTALLYLEEALFKEQYEDCDELIQSAKGFGAQLYEIKAVIFGFLNKGKGGLQNEASRNAYGFPRLKGGK
jgi:hypothetical protein